MLSARSQLPGLKGFAYYDAIGPWGADKGLDVQLNFNYYFFWKKKTKQTKDGQKNKRKVIDAVLLWGTKRDCKKE